MFKSIASIGTYSLVSGLQLNNQIEEHRGRDDYTGIQDKTKTGKKCLNWEDSIKGRHVIAHYPDWAFTLRGHNHCRDPDGYGKVWCYHKDYDEDDEDDGSLAWEVCSKQLLYENGKAS